MDRRGFLGLLGRAGGAGAAAALELGGCGGGGRGGEPRTAAAPGRQAALRAQVPGPQVADIVFDPTAAGTPIARSLLGSNVQWTDNGDNMLMPDGSADALMLAQARTVAPTVLRYPGGAQSDIFQWDSPTNVNVFTNAVQSTTMDTQSVLELCEALGAEPLFTVNIVSGTVDDAVRWITRTNVDGLVSRNTGQPLPKVMRWELGNEPYLTMADRPDLSLAPADYAARLNAFIPALRAVDPTIRIGVPLTTDQRNGVWVTPYQGFTTEVLQALSEPFDFACLHDAYMPYATDGTSDTTTLYRAAMAGAHAVADDLAAMRALLAGLMPGATIPIAITEWAPLFSLGQPTDPLIVSPTAGLYAADLLRMLAGQDGLELANHWSLSGDWLFGAISQTGFPRSVGCAIGLAQRALAGVRLPAQVACQTMATPALGQVGAYAALPVVEALATRGDDGIVRLLAINKDLDRKAQVAVDLSGHACAAATLTTLACDDPFADTDLPGLMQFSTSAPAAGATLRITLPPHSIAVLELTMAG